MILLAQSVAAPLPWAQFGALALVVGALFTLLTYLLGNHSKERKELDDKHRDERKEWLASFEKGNERMEGVVKELTTAIRENKGH